MIPLPGPEAADPPVRTYKVFHMVPTVIVHVDEDNREEWVEKESFFRVEAQDEETALLAGRLKYPKIADRIFKAEPVVPDD